MTSLDSKGWSFKARFEDIDLERVCREAEEEGLRCIEVTCDDPSVGPRVLCTTALFKKLRTITGVQWYSVPSRLHAPDEAWCLDDGCAVAGWRVLYSAFTGKPMSAARVAELLDELRNRVTVRVQGISCSATKRLRVGDSGRRRQKERPCDP